MLRSRVCFCILCPLLGLVLALLLIFGARPAATAQQPGPKSVSFINDVAPIFQEHGCYACHDPKKKKGKLDMSTFASFRKGGGKDDPIVPGSPNKSVLIDVLTTNGITRMPPKEVGDPLSKEEVEVIAQWIKEGGKLDPDVEPKAELLRELRIRFKPPTPPAVYKFPVIVNALAFTPDGKRLVIGGYHELIVWDIEQGKLEKRLYTRSERAYGMVFLPDGKLAVAGGRPAQEGEVSVYDLNGGTPKAVDGVAILDGVNDKGVLIKVLLACDDTVLAIALSPDGKKLVAGGVDRIVRVWDLSGGIANAKLDQSVENHADWVFGVNFSVDGKYLLTASRDKTAKIWDLAEKQSVVTFPDHQNGVYGVALSHDGKVGMSVAEDGNLRFWQATDAAKQIGKQIKVGIGHGKGVFRLVFHSDPNNPVLATCSADGTVKLWNVKTQAATRTLSSHSDWVYALALSPDASLLASGDRDGEVRVWRVSDGTLVKSFNASPGYVKAVDGK